MANVGIDFGTSNSSVMFYNKEGRLVSLLRKEESPSAAPVGFVPTEVYLKKNGTFSCGWEISEAVRSTNLSENLVRNLKEKLIDDTYTGTILGYDKWYLFQSFMQYLINNANKSPHLGTNDKVTKVVLSFPVENVSSLFITKMKECTEAITYTDYNGNQYSDLKVVALQEEPVAISLNYYATYPANKKVLICDVGGGTTDIAIVENNNYARRVKEHTGINKAGNYMDRMILKYLLAETSVSLEEFEAASNVTLNRTLHTIKCTKENVEEMEVVPVEIVYEKKVIFEADLSVEEYYWIIDDFVLEVIEKCKEMIKNCPVDAIVLAGGASNCKRMKQLFELERAFSKIEIFCNEVDKRTATAGGNAERFKMVTENASTHNTEKVTIQNILNHSYGTDCFTKQGEKLMRILFHKNEVLPIQERRVGFLTRDTTSSVQFDFYLGQDTNTEIVREFDLDKYSQLVGKNFKYQFGKLVPKGTRMEAYFGMDENYVMHISVKSTEAIIRTQEKSLTGLE